MKKAMTLAISGCGLKYAIVRMDADDGHRIHCVRHGNLTSISLDHSQLSFAMVYVRDDHPFGRLPARRGWN